MKATVSGVTTSLSVLGVAVGCALAFPNPVAAQDAAALSRTAVSSPGVVTRREGPAVKTPDPLRHVPDELLVRFRPGLAHADTTRTLSRIPSEFARASRSVENLYHVKLTPGVSLRQAVRTLRKDRGVLYVEPNFVVEAFGVPNDPRFANHGHCGTSDRRAAPWEPTSGRCRPGTSPPAAATSWSP
jgi:hypothetical protein